MPAVMRSRRTLWAGSQLVRSTSDDHLSDFLSRYNIDFLLSNTLAVASFSEANWKLTNAKLPS